MSLKMYFGRRDRGYWAMLEGRYLGKLAWDRGWSLGWVAGMAWVYWMYEQDDEY